MRENNRRPIASFNKFPQFTIMNAIDGQAGLIIYDSLIFYSLTTDNILNIIVLLILAGVSISMLASDNGILKRTTDAQIQTTIAAKKEEVLFAINEELILASGDSSKVTVPNVLNKVKNNYTSASEKSKITTEPLGEDENKFPAKIIYSPPTSNISEKIAVEVDENLSIIYAGIYEKDNGFVKGSEIAKFVDEIEQVQIPESKYTKVGNLYVNSPDLSGFNPESTYYVTYDSSGENEKVLGRIDRLQVADNKIVTNNTETSNIWYDYEHKIWANVVTVMGDDVTYWTWVPRYKYNPTGASESSVTTKFVNNQDTCTDASGNPVDLTGYELPDSFSFGTQQKLSGFWMSKYEIQNTSVDVMTAPVKNDQLTVNTSNASGKYTIFVNGKQFKTGVSLPYSIDGVKTNKACDICIYSEDSKRMIGRSERDTNSIEVDTSGFDKSHTYYITYDATGENETIAGRMDKINPKDNLVGTGSNNVWYDYSAKIWANMVTVTGDSVTYWTYVPRYEYMEITSNSTAQAKFIPYTQTVADAGYSISDAFTFGDNKNLKGYWMSKYEVQDSSANGVEKIVISEQTSSKVTVKTSLTDSSPNRTYYVYLNGSKYSNVAVTLPYDVNVKAGEEKSIMLYSVDDKRIIGETSVLPSNIIEVDGSGFSTDNTYYVLYDADGSNERIGGKIELEQNGNIKIPDTSQGTWYNYENKIWANVVTKGKDENNNELITYWTYIPRCEYIENTSNSTANIQFIPQSQTVPDTGWQISEAFTFDGNPLKGYWMSKYEVQQSTQQTQ